MVYVMGENEYVIRIEILKELINQTKDELLISDYFFFIGKKRLKKKRFSYI